MEPAVAIELLSGVPVLLYIVMVALLPILFIPTSILWVATGAIYGFENGLFVLTSSTLINFPIAYWIGNRWMRGYVELWLRRRRLEIPSLGRGSYLELTLALRLMPGVPQILQSYFLGVSRVPFTTYMIGSLPPQIFYAAAFLLIGDSILHGEILLFALALSTLIFLHLAYKYWVSRSRGLRDESEKRS